jgi:hypothetical protein
LHNRGRSPSMNVQNTTQNCQNNRPSQKSQLDLNTELDLNSDPSNWIWPNEVIPNNEPPTLPPWSVTVKINRKQTAHISLPEGTLLVWWTIFFIFKQNGRLTRMVETSFKTAVSCLWNNNKIVGSQHGQMVAHWLQSCRSVVWISVWKM